MRSKESYIEAIQQALQRRDFDAAIRLADEALQRYAEDPFLLSLRQRAEERMEAEPFLQSFMASGVSLFNSGLYRDALKQFEKVQQLDPTYPELREWIQKTRERLHQAETGPAEIPGPSPAPEVPEEAPVQETPDPVQVLIRKGQELFDRGRYHDAIQVWTEVFMHDLTNQQVHGLIQAAQQKLDEQRQRIRTLFAEAQDAFNRNEIEQAIPKLQEILRLDPDHEEARHLLASLIKVTPSASVGEETIPRGQKPVLEDVFSEALRAHQERRWNDAVRLWQAVLRQDPENAGAQTKYNEALRQLRVEMQLRKLLGDAQAFWAQGKRDSALHALQKAYRLRPDHPDLQARMAEWGITTGDLERAFGPQAPAPTRGTAVLARRMGFPLPRRTVLVLLGAVVFAGGLIWWLGRQQQTPSPQPLRSPVSPVVSRSVPSPVNPRARPTPSPTSERSEDLSEVTSPAAVEPTSSLTPTQRRQRDRLLDQAGRLYEQGKLEEAYERVQAALALDPHHPEAQRLQDEIGRTLMQRDWLFQERIQIVETYYRSYDFDGALYMLNKLREEFPDRPEVIDMMKRTYYNAALYYLRMLRCKVAKERLDVIPLLDPRETGYRDLRPLILRCIQEQGLDPETRRRVRQMPYLPLKD